MAMLAIARQIAIKTNPPEGHAETKTPEQGA
jgi:hypothetical protein